MLDIKGNIHFANVQPEDTSNLYECVANSPLAKPSTTQGAVQVIEIDSGKFATRPAQCFYIYSRVSKHSFRKSLSFDDIECPTATFKKTFICFISNYNDLEIKEKRKCVILYRITKCYTIL